MAGGQFNPYATPFQPGGFGGNQLYGAGAYPMGGDHCMLHYGARVYVSQNDMVTIKLRQIVESVKQA